VGKLVALCNLHQAVECQSFSLFENQALVSVLMYGSFSIQMDLHKPEKIQRDGNGIIFGSHMLAAMR
jgi:hypothetical protein